MKVVDRMRRDGWNAIGRTGYWEARHAGMIVEICPGEASAFHHSKEHVLDRVLVVRTEARHGMRNLAQRAKALARKLARERGNR
jgi:hypothetical protein